MEICLEFYTSVNHCNRRLSAAIVTSPFASNPFSIYQSPITN